MNPKIIGALTAAMAVAFIFALPSLFAREAADEVEPIEFGVAPQPVREIDREPGGERSGRSDAATVSPEQAATVADPDDSGGSGASTESGSVEDQVEASADTDNSGPSAEQETEHAEAEAPDAEDADHSGPSGADNSGDSGSGDSSSDGGDGSGSSGSGSGDSDPEHVEGSGT